MVIAAVVRLVLTTGDGDVTMVTVAMQRVHVSIAGVTITAKQRHRRISFTRTSRKYTCMYIYRVRWLETTCT